MTNKKIDEIRGMVSDTTILTIEEQNWLKKHNPSNDKCIVLAPEYTPTGPEHISEKDREMIKQIKAKLPELVFIELSKTDTQL